MSNEPYVFRLSQVSSRQRLIYTYKDILHIELFSGAYFRQAGSTLVICVWTSANVLLRHSSKGGKRLKPLTEGAALCHFRLVEGN